MKASELRIGNWLLNPYSNEPEKVESIRPVHALNTDYEVNEDHPDLLKPIPLTEEWLLKFGFGLSDEHECGHNTNEAFGFYYDWHFKRLRLEAGTADIADVYLLHIQYVHQLQNLYFGLTGEELTIK
jgi:hypothetical protein